MAERISSPGRGESGRNRGKNIARIIVSRYNYREYLHVKGAGVRRLVAFFAGSLLVLLVNLLSRWFLAVKGFDSVYLKGCA